MLLAVDVGNTQTVLGLFRGDELADSFRLATDRSRTGDELGVTLAALLRARGRRRDLPLDDGAGAAARVGAGRGALGARAAPDASGPGVKTGIPIRYDDPREVGPDRIVNAVAAKERYGAPCIVVDFGTVDELRHRLAGGRVRRRRARARDRGLDGRALRPGRAARQGRLRRAADGDREDDRRRAPVRARLRVRRPGGRDRRADPRGARRRGADGRDGRPRRA